MDGGVSRGHQIGLIRKMKLRQRTQAIPTGESQQQGTTAAIRIIRLEDRGAIPLIQTGDGNIAPFHSVPDGTPNYFSV